MCTRRFLLQPPQGFDAIDAWKPDIEQHQVVRILVDFFQALLARGHDFSRKSFVFENAFQRVPDAGLVIDNEDSWHIGSSMTNRVPFGEFGSTPMYPPWSATIRLPHPRPKTGARFCFTCRP